ncbi:MAG: PKD domain-containing protein [Chitinophagaceae bacterium]
MKKLFSILLVVFAISNTYSQSANWTAVLPNFFPTNVSGQINGLTRVSQMKFHPSNPNKRYAVSARGGLFISTNSGNTWTVAPGTDFMPYARLASVCIDHTNDQILYLGTGDHNYYYTGSGVYKSTDGGNNFTPMGLSGLLVIDMIMDPLDHLVIVAITNSGIYKTTNGGSTWTLKTSTFAGDDIKQKSINSRVLYATSDASEFYRSTNFGDTWTQITNGIVLPTGITNGNGCRVAVTPADTNIVYLGMVANGGILYKSIDGGTTFTGVKTSASPYLTYYTNSSTSSSQGDYNFGIGVDRLNANIVYLVAHNNWKSIDGGITWTQLTNWWQKCHTDMHQIINNPYNNNELYNMNDGGVWLSTDGGNNWTAKCDGMNAYEIYHGNCSPTRKDMISIGTQDNGELYATNSGWFTNRGGDWASQCAFDYRANSAVVYYYSNNKRRTVTSGDATYGLPAQVTKLHDIAFHRSNPNLAFVADSFIYRTSNLTNTTPTWTQIASLGKDIKAMHSAFDNANYLYIITNDAMIHVSSNALSATPTFTSYTLPSSSNNRASITTIASAPGTVYITINTKAYKSTNYGATWTNITYNLPTTNHIKIIADEFISNNQLVFVASNNTVYYKTMNANSWTLYNTNLPSRPTAIDLSIYNDGTSNSVLRYASYGRSVWETSFADLHQLTANFAANDPNPCIGNTVQFSDLSTGTATSWLWSFPGGTPSSSSLANPSIVYNSPGTYAVSLTVSNGTTNSSITQNNYIATNGASLPISEGFEGTDDPPLGWKNVDNNTSGIAWAKSLIAGGYGNSTSSMMFDNYSWNYPNEKDEIWTKKIDLFNLSGAKLFFDVAYKTYPGYNDSLSVLVSTNCGASFTKVYSRGGSDLSLGLSTTSAFVPIASEWQSDTINLSSFIGNPNVIIAFQNTNGYGNRIYLDNINVISVSGCTTPLIGGTISGPSNLTAGVSYTYSLTGNTGNTIQWQSSLNNGTTWNNIAGANNSTQGINLTAGTYWLRAVSSQTGTNCVDAYSNILTLTVSAPPGDVFSNPIVVSSPFAQTYNSAIGYSNAYTGTNQQVSPDIFFAITTGPCTDSLKISTCGSNFDTYLHFLDALGNHIVSVDDDGPYCAGLQSSMKLAVMPNTTYYVVVEGYSGNAGIVNMLIEEIDNPTLSVTASNVSGCVNSAINLIGSPSGGTFSVSNPYIGTNSTTYTYTYTDPNGCSATSAQANITITNCVVTVQVKSFIEGFYIGSNSMQNVLANQGVGVSSSDVDDVSIALHSTTSPYSMLYSFSGKLQTNGSMVCTFPISAVANSYYIVFKHRNSIETWSSSPVLITNNMLYDFTLSQNQAYGNNQVAKGTLWTIYSGDINQDGFVDIFDFLSWDIDNQNFASGYYATDLNGDGFIDIFDFLVWDPNNQFFIGVITP